MRILFSSHSKQYNQTEIQAKCALGKCIFLIPTSLPITHIYHRASISIYICFSLTFLIMGYIEN